ncbi:MAG: YheU family protein [Alcanivorax jadensis]|uniref:YheU family protein n=1 Tax=Alcanivorax jadensis TaxID=64988 RepID=UPI003002698F|tara:strand:- start:578 stop:817 length:240 start_codon:yes stop_codon:yes gene_type:complete
MPIIVPWKDLPADTLTNLIEEFVTRDGTDYGDQEIPTATKVEQVRNQLKKQEAFVVFDEVTESVSVMGKEQANEAVNSE